MNIASTGAEIQPHYTTRRALFGAVPALAITATAAAAFSGPTEVIETDSPVLALFREWQETFDAMDDLAYASPEWDEAGAELYAIQRRMQAMPTTSAADLAAKIIAACRDGDYALSLMVGPARPGAMLVEMRALVRGAM